MTEREKIDFLEMQNNELREAVSGVIRANGRYDFMRHEWDINFSSILTKLIQETGRFCESFASDLFVQWKYRIDERLANGTIEEGTEVFAIREMGVDHKEWYENHKDDPRYYRAVWFLDIYVDNGEIELVLHK